MNSFISRVKKINDEFERDDYKIINTHKEHDMIRPQRHNAREPGEDDNYSDTDDEMPELVDIEQDNRMEKLLFVEYDVYCKWNEWLSNEFRVRPDAYIYLRCFPNVNHDRISKRNREGEENIPIEYLQILHDKHEQWMAREKETVPVLTIDALQNFNDPVVMERIAEEIFYFVR